MSQGLAQAEQANAAVEFRPEQWYVTSEKIIKVVSCLLNSVQPLQVIAFGSRARGDHRADSDLDLAVITEGIPDGTRFGGKTPFAWRPAGLGREMNLDVLYMTRQRYVFMKDSFISVECQIARQGLLLYDSSVGTIDKGVAERLAQGPGRSESRPAGHHSAFSCAAGD